jgi:hypothetical protein
VIAERNEQTAAARKKMRENVTVPLDHQAAVLRRTLRLSRRA